jgi:hypothetical protein
MVESEISWSESSLEARVGEKGQRTLAVRHYGRLAPDNSTEWTRSTAQPMRERVRPAEVTQGESSATASSCLRRRNWVCSRAFLRTASQPLCIHSQLATYQCSPATHYCRLLSPEEKLGLFARFLENRELNPFASTYQSSLDTDHDFSGHSPPPPLLASGELKL